MSKPKCDYCGKIVTQKNEPETEAIEIDIGGYTERLTKMHERFYWIMCKECIKDPETNRNIAQHIWEQTKMDELFQEEL